MLLSIAAAAAAFNLVCSGKFQVGDLTKPFDLPDAPVTTRVYRVDLDAGRWCSGACETSDPLVSVSSTQIIFRAEDRGELDDTLLMVNREDGTILDRVRTFPAVAMYSGECQPAPFTGLPTPKF